MKPDDELARETGTEIDVSLSALLDGELDATSAAELRARLVVDPVLAERTARFGEVDGQIRGLAAEAPDADRLARLRAALQIRLDAEPDGAAREGGTDSSRGRAPVPRPRRDRRSWLRTVAPYAALLAAGLALYFLGGSRGFRGLLRPEPRIAEIASPAPLDGPASPAPVRDAGSAVLESGRTARSTAADTEVRARSRADVAPDSIDASGEDPVLDSLSDEELAVALQLDVLADLDEIENLEVLELLAQLDAPEPL